jgi:hypothetical protein
VAGFDVRVPFRSLETYLVAAHGGPRSLAIDELDILDTYAAQVTADIEEAWPVDTGTSRDAFFYTILDDPEIGFTISNDADYAEWVHPKGDPDPLVDTLVETVIDRYAPRVISEMQGAIDATEERATENTRKGGRGILDVLSHRFAAPSETSNVG